MMDNTLTPARTTHTMYIAGFTYQNDTLQFVMHEEGRIRWANHFYLNGQSEYKYEYDYFLKDHLGNIRMVLTEQKDTVQYMATMEAMNRNVENKLFQNLKEANYASSLVSGYPADNTTNPNDSIMRLNGSGQRVGAAMVLKVMSGDKIDLAVRAFYKDQSVNAPNSPLNDIVNALASGLLGVAGTAKGTLTQLNNPSGPLVPGLQSFMSSNNPTVPSKPRAYLNWVLLDEQLQYVSSFPQSGALPVGNYPSNTLNPLAYTGIDITKNGYLYVYVSNETPGWDVFFDNLSVRHYTGPILEETHYYPFGLTMAGISSKALNGAVENKHKFNKGSKLQDKEFSDGSGLDWYATQFRSLDPQLGRWWQIDPKPDLAQSPFSSMGNNPIRFNDPMGDTLTVTGSSAAKTEFRQINNSALGGFYKTVIDKNGKVSFVSTG